MLRRRIKNILTDEEFAKIIDAIKKPPKKKLSRYQKFSRMRDIMMMKLSIVNGFRPKEVYNAKVCHIKINERKYFIPAENNKQRFEDEWILPEIIIPDLQVYMQVRNKLYPDSPWLFPCMNINAKNPTGRCDRNTPVRTIKRLAKAAGIMKTVNFYTLRHSYGTKTYIFHKDIKKGANLMRQYDNSCRSYLRYVHTANTLERPKLINEMYSTSNFAQL